jgi:hypothetical protein
MPTTLHPFIEMNVELQKQVERLGVEAAAIRQLHEADMEVAAQLRAEANARQAHSSASASELGSVQLLLLAAQQGLADRERALADAQALQVASAAELNTLRATSSECPHPVNTWFTCGTHVYTRM